VETPQKQRLEADMSQKITRKLWVEPAIRELDTVETHAFPGTGTDVGGNTNPDCQFS
jgi:hypothetical protein